MQTVFLHIALLFPGLQEDGGAYLKRGRGAAGIVTFPTQVMPLGIQVSAGYRETKMLVTVRGHPVLTYSLASRTCAHEQLPALPAAPHFP